LEIGGQDTSMNWHEALLRQARSDEAVRRRLNDSATEYSHRLHYLQMVTEKLAKAFQVSPDDPQPPSMTHRAFVRFLQILKSRPDIQRQLGYRDGKVFGRLIDSLLDLARQIQSLAPSIAHLTQPNPEYPWWDSATNDVKVPAEYDFSQFNPNSVKMIKLDSLVRDILRIAT
jgi:hypothetical protein